MPLPAACETLFVRDNARKQWRHRCGERAGRDESGKMGEAVHGREMLARVKCVGELVEDDG
jgi:predicted heme/steroid binding protein